MSDQSEVTPLRLKRPGSGGGATPPTPSPAAPVSPEAAPPPSAPSPSMPSMPTSPIAGTETSDAGGAPRLRRRPSLSAETSEGAGPIAGSTPFPPLESPVVPSPFAPSATIPPTPPPPPAPPPAEPAAGAGGGFKLKISQKPPAPPLFVPSAGPASTPPVPPPPAFADTDGNASPLMPLPGMPAMGSPLAPLPAPGGNKVPPPPSAGSLPPLPGAGGAPSGASLPPLPSLPPLAPLPGVPVVSPGVPPGAPPAVAGAGTRAPFHVRSTASVSALDPSKLPGAKGAGGKHARRDALIFALVFLVIAGLGGGAYYFLTRPGKATATIGEVRAKLEDAAKLPGKAVDNAKDALSGARDKEQSRVDAVFEGREAPTERAVGNVSPGELQTRLAEANDRSVATAAAPVANTVESVATTTHAGEGPVEGAPPPPPDASPRLVRYAESIRVSGVFQGSPARALVDGRLVRAGDVIEPNFGISFVGVDAGTKHLILEEQGGAQVRVKY